jgi:hypothetical protein
MPSDHQQRTLTTEVSGPSLTMKRVLCIVLVVAVLAATAWGTAALAIAGPQWVWLREAVAASYAAGVLAVLLLVRPFWRALGIWSAAFAALLVWWSTIQPSNDRDWQPDVARVAWVDVHGNTLNFHNIRNFDYRSETDFRPRYEDRAYHLSKLRGLDLFMSYWGSPAIAHTIMSWQFDGSPPLAISIETRKTKGQTYSTVDGFFKQYEVIYVAGDERDLVRLRTNFRHEQVYLYRLAVPLPRARALLMDYVASMNALVQHPQFYNALTDNCTTSIRRHVTRIDPDAPPFDWRLLANGYGDRLLYERGELDRHLPFAELRARSLINAKAQAADQDSAFSQRIREGLPNPRVVAQ